MGVLHGFGVFCVVAGRCEMCKNLLFCNMFFTTGISFHQKGPKADMTSFPTPRKIHFFTYPVPKTQGKQVARNARGSELASHPARALRLESGEPGEFEDLEFLGQCGSEIKKTGKVWFC